MRNPVIDSVWEQIRHLEMGGAAAAQAKLQEVVSIGRAIHAAHGEQVANEIMDYGLIETALYRCRQIQDHELNGIGYDELQIFYRYATSAMSRAQTVIDTHYAELGL
ncbi:hypothetical protein HB13667_07905 [Pseudomonas putida]|uniref:Uncharacterized protein n=1 Tax=Pseudomonas putida TaxID=303 RepID=A0A0P7CH74_PSEPU|nr:hypothetical protein [Pseudomonas putida]KPM66907.1 hypothetical protein HB13667_07905 [Pseudomonas putida]